ncbi:uncharacterized protein At4g04775-like [Lotus japonicus]|uniref:uncharacterized protein At4g04775-like n=1 Tax=Lotus japonicus TaxID=34305 RepID=UPI0025905AF7|nr:uncharacterized protein At4g04775-like [Lotus japonicus]
MARTTSCSSSSLSLGRSTATVVLRRGFCDCGERILYLTSHSDANPGRKFWRCKNWKSPTECGFFLWDDETVFDAAHRRTVIELTKTLHELGEMKKKVDDSKKDLDEMKIKAEELKMKNDKVHRKLEKEIWKKNMAIVCLVLS